MKTSYVVLAILAVAMIVLASGVDAKKRHKAKSAGSAASVEVEHVPEECGQKTQNGDSLSMHYTGKLEDGTGTHPTHSPPRYTHTNTTTHTHTHTHNTSYTEEH